MIVKVCDMPTNGYLNTEEGEINIEPLKFGDLIRYLGDEQLTELREYTRCLEYLVKHDPRVGTMSILDADYIMYIFKSLSTTKKAVINFNVSCPYCGGNHSKKLELNEIVFRDIPPEVLNIGAIKLGNKDVEIQYTTISEFLVFVSKLKRFQENIGIDSIKLASLLKLEPSSAVDLICNSTQEDISLINYLDNVFFKLTEEVVINCPTDKNKRGTTAAFNMSAVDIFRSIIELNTITNQQVLFRKIE